MPVRVFTQAQGEIITISGKEFPLKPLPSRKARFLTDLTGGNISGLLDELSKSLDGLDDTDQIGALATHAFNSRYKIISFGLQIEDDSDQYSDLVEAIDEAGFPEIIWVLDQILDVNGFKYLERLVKNLISRLDKILPDLRNDITHYMRKYLENRRLEDALKNLQQTGSTSSSSDSEEIPSDSPKITSLTT